VCTAARQARVSVKSENREQGVVNSPLLFLRQLHHVSSESLDVDRPELLHEYPGGRVVHPYLGSKRRGPGTGRGRRDDDDRAREERVGLEYHGESFALLFMTDTRPRLETEYFTAPHARSP
jgi:hypothetical protein